MSIRGHDGPLISAAARAYLDSARAARHKARRFCPASAAEELPPGSCPCRKPIGWRLTENRAMLICNERSCQAHCLGGCRSASVAGGDRGRDFNVAAADHCSATNRPQEKIL